MYKQIANDSRKKVLELVYRAGTSHIGSLMGSAELFAVIFEKIDLDKDKFVLSAGWKAAMLYYHLWRKGRMTLKELNSYCQPGSKWIGLAEPIHKDISFAGGSMGYGLPAAVGFALSKKLKGEEGVVYCLMSDGELQCGTVWEAALIAAHHRLDNLVVFVEANGFQAMGRVEDILHAGFPTKNWSAHLIDGHDCDMIDRAIYAGSKGVGCPLVFIAKTTKGKGVSFMENVNLWHYAKLQEEDYKKALECLK
jgi:transketolase